MKSLAVRSGFVLSCLAAATFFLSAGEPALAQKKPSSIREFLMQFKGKEVFVMDKTTGVEQFVNGDASKAYSVVLNDVQTDYIVVTRDTETDKRTFLYPLTVIRRIIFQNNGKPYEKIVLEMY